MSRRLNKINAYHPLLIVLIIAFVLPMLSMKSLRQGLSVKQQKHVQEFTTLIKDRKIKELALRVSYPLERPYPLPPIRSKAAFEQSFNGIFDKALIDLIITANARKDWHDMGWRGIMLKNGEIWLDDSGNLTAINYESAAEIKSRALLIQKEKKSLHPSLTNFKRPVLKFTTTKYIVRIDELEAGKFRYTSWKVSALMNEMPDLTLTNGKVIPIGSGGNHYYEFKNGIYTYQCHIHVLGDGSQPPATLVVKKREVEILSAPALTLQQ